MATPEHRPETAAAAPSSTDATLETLWARLVDAVGRASPFTRTYLLEAHPVSFTNSLFIIGFTPEVEEHLGLVDNARNHTLLQTKLAELGYAGAQVKFVKAEAPAGRITPAPQAASAPPSSGKGTQPAKGKSSGPASPPPKGAPASLNQEDFKNDPLIQKALEIFKGQIVEVRG